MKETAEYKMSQSSFFQLFHDGGLYHTEICSANQWDWFLFDRDLRHERVI